jgi:hypothetical protein
VGTLLGPSTAVEGATNIGARSGLNGAGYFSTAMGAGLTGNDESTAKGSFSIAIGGGDSSNVGAVADGAA